MQPNQIAVDRFSATLVAASGPFGADSEGLEVKLAAQPFTPGLGLLESDLVEATFVGYAAKTAVAPQLLIRRPGGGNWGILLVEPAGGFKWICTTAPVSAQTIYGFFALGDAGDIYSALLAVPKVIQFVGDYVEISAELGFLTTSPLGNN